MTSPFANSDFGAKSAPRPAFDIVLAVASARQSASPTARLLMQLASNTVHGGAPNDCRRSLMNGTMVGGRASANAAARFAPVHWQHEPKV